VAISEAKKKIVIDNYFKKECDVNTSIKEAFIKGFELGLKKAPRPQLKTGHWEYVQYDYNPNIGNWHCSECRNIVIECADKNKDGGIPTYSYCPKCGVKMIEPFEL